MEIKKSNRDLLIRLYKNGYVANWYNTYGKYKLKIYKQEEEKDDHIILGIDKAGALDISTSFSRINVFSEENQERLKEFETAIQIYLQSFPYVKRD